MRKYSWLAASSLTLAAAPAIADTSSFTDMFKYNGFGTAGVARSDTNEAEFVQSGQNLGATENFDWKTDSKLGLQGSVSPTSWLSGTVQMLSAERFSNHISTEIEWAFAKVTPLPGLSLRGGKMALPTFLVSDSRYVGYANNWVRAPDEVYGPATFDTFKGYDVSYQHAIGKYSLTVGALAGSTVADFMLYPGVAIIAEGHNLRGYSATFDMNVATVRVSRVTSDITVILGGPILAKLVYTFTSFGVTYDHDNVVAQGEFIEKRSDGSVGPFSPNGWYVMGGYHVNKWLPYAIYAAGHQNGGAGGTVHEANRSTASVGVRLDLIKNVDVKAQIDHVKAYPDGNPFINVRPGFNDRANVVSLVVDFVF
jgi:hypothetical protein